MEDKLATYEAELKSINESTKSIAKNRGNEYMYVDSSITHGAPQRMEISEARAELQAKISEANSHMAVLHMEEEAILQAIKLRAVVHLQKTYKMKKTRERFLILIAEYREMLRQEAAVLIQKRVRMLLAAKVLAALALARRRRLGAIQIQRVFRGLVARKVYARMVDAALRRARKRATVRIQTIVRMRRASTLLAGMRQRAALLAAMRRKAAAINIQRMVRGWIAKRRKYARRVELSLGPRIRELCARFIAKGDLYGFLEAVNADFELQVAQQAEMRMLEVENARTFIREVLAWRESEVEKIWTKWSSEKGGDISKRIPRNRKRPRPVQRLPSRRKQRRYRA